MLLGNKLRMRNMLPIESRVKGHILPGQKLPAENFACRYYRSPSLPMVNTTGLTFNWHKRCDASDGQNAHRAKCSL